MDLAALVPEDFLAKEFASDAPWLKSAGWEDWGVTATVAASGGQGHGSVATDRGLPAGSLVNLFADLESHQLHAEAMDCLDFECKLPLEGHQLAGLASTFEQGLDQRLDQALRDMEASNQAAAVAAVAEDKLELLSRRSSTSGSSDASSAGTLCAVPCLSRADTFSSSFSLGGKPYPDDLLGDGSAFDSSLWQQPTGLVKAEALPAASLAPASMRPAATLEARVVPDIGAALLMPAIRAPPRPAQGQPARTLSSCSTQISESEAAGALAWRTSRAEILSRYREKRQRRLFTKTVRYHMRKENADRRPRIKGRFVKAEELAAYLADR